MTQKTRQDILSKVLNKGIGLFKNQIKLNYAETHFKFKLPWSKLFKKQAHIFADAPFQVLPGQSLPLFVVAKNAHQWPFELISIDLTVYRVKDQQLLQKELLTLNQKFDQAISFYELPLSLSLPPGDYHINLYFHIKSNEKNKEKSYRFAHGNTPGIALDALIVRFLQCPLPYPNNWKAGEHHCHTQYTSDPVEFGAPPWVLQKAARTVGLDYVVLTDHSYNFYYDNAEYMCEVDPQKQYAEFVAECKSLEEYPKMIPAIEASVGNSQNQNVHLLAITQNQFVEGRGDSGRRWLNNKPDLKIAEVIKQNPKGVFWAAHPKAKIGWLERKIFNRGEWNEVDLAEGLKGLQFWNGHKDDSFYAGKEFWIQQLLKGRRLLPLAANDAHGDLNRNISIKTPLFKTQLKRNHLFGRLRTLWPLADQINSQEINSELFKGSICTLTEGPFASLTINPQKNTGESKSVRVFALSNEDWGALAKLTLIGGSCKQNQESKIKEWAELQQLETEVFYSEICQFDYIRLEGQSTVGYDVITSALWVNDCK